MKKTLHHPTLHPSRVLTETAMATHTYDFIHTPVGQALFDALKERLGLTVVAGYLVINGTGPYEILDLFVDRAKVIRAGSAVWQMRHGRTMNSTVRSGMFCLKFLRYTVLHRPSSGHTTGKPEC